MAGPLGRPPGGLRGGEYGAWAPAVEALLREGAILLPELYFHRSRDCANGCNGGERDIWLASMFAGAPALRRVGWLLDERNRLGSTSQIPPSFAVIDVRCRTPEVSTSPRMTAVAGTARSVGVGLHERDDEAPGPRRRGS